jgi:DNA-binding beta-propeller fold protein YncE
LGTPACITVDSNGNSYITDTQHECVRKFDRSRNFIRQWGSSGTGPGQFDHPNGVAAFSGNSILVVDTNNARIQEFSRDGVFITTWGSRGTGSNEFIGPIGVAINKTNDMHYISDSRNNRIQRFHPNAAIDRVSSCSNIYS